MSRVWTAPPNKIAIAPAFALSLAIEASGEVKGYGAGHGVYAAEIAGDLVEAGEERYRHSRSVQLTLSPWMCPWLLGVPAKVRDLFATPLLDSCTDMDSWARSPSLAQC